MMLNFFKSKVFNIFFISYSLIILSISFMLYEHTNVVVVSLKKGNIEIPNVNKFNPQKDKNTIVNVNEYFKFLYEKKFRDLDFSKHTNEIFEVNLTVDNYNKTYIFKINYKNKKINLKNNVDAFASAANYLSKIGWMKNEPCFYKVSLNKNIPDKYLNKNDLLIINDTKVIPARIFGNRKNTKGKVEIFVERILSETGFICQIKSTRKINVNDIIIVDNNVELEIKKTVKEKFWISLRKYLVSKRHKRRKTVIQEVQVEVEKQVEKIVEVPVKEKEFIYIPLLTNSPDEMMEDLQKKLPKDVFERVKFGFKNE